MGACTSFGCRSTVAWLLLKKKSKKKKDAQARRDTIRLQYTISKSYFPLKNFAVRGGGDLYRGQNGGSFFFSTRYHPRHPFAAFLFRTYSIAVVAVAPHASRLVTQGGKPATALARDARRMFVPVICGVFTGESRKVLQTLTRGDNSFLLLIIIALLLNLHSSSRIYIHETVPL